MSDSSREGSIFKRITQLVVRVADLMEAEGRSLRDATRTEGKVLRQVAARMTLGVAVLVIASPLAILGLCLLLGSLYLVLKGQIGPPGAAAITGVITLAVAGGLLWYFKTLTK